MLPRRAEMGFKFLNLSDDKSTCINIDNGERMRLPDIEYWPTLSPDTTTRYLELPQIERV